MLTIVKLSVIEATFAPPKLHFDLVELLALGMRYYSLACSVSALKVTNMSISFRDVVKAAFVELVVDVVGRFDANAEETFLMSKLHSAVIQNVDR